MHKSIPEYIEELNKDQLYSVIEHANDKLEKLDKAEKIGIWQVQDNWGVLAEFKSGDYLLAAEKLKSIANIHYSDITNRKEDLELSIKYVLIDQYDYDELFEEDL